MVQIDSNIESDPMNKTSLEGAVDGAISDTSQDLVIWGRGYKTGGIVETKMKIHQERNLFLYINCYCIPCSNSTEKCPVS